MHIQTWAKSLKGTDLLLFVVASVTAVVLGGMTARIGKDPGSGAGGGTILYETAKPNAASVATAPAPTAPAPTPTPPLQSAVPMPLMAAPAPPPPPPPAPVVSQLPASSNALVITTCNGQLGSANLRQFPGFSAPVLGAIAPGETVQRDGKAERYLAT